MHLLYNEYKDRVEFVAIYISEAHAKNQWKLGDAVNINQHESLEDRIAAAQSFVNDMKYQIPVVVDSMSNAFDQVYAVWPDRYFVIEQGVLKLVPSPGTYGYDRMDLHFWLLSRFPKPQELVAVEQE